MTALPVPSSRRQLATLDQLAAIPEEEIWLEKQKSRQTRRAYRLDVRHFMQALDITSVDQLRQIDHRAVIAWERMQREQEAAKSSTVRRRLAALSSLFKHLVRHGVVARNPVVDVERPTINRIEGSTAAFSKIQARKILDAPAADTLAGLRDRAILSVGLQVGFRRAEIAALNVGDLHQNRGFDALRVVRKGGRREALAINLQAAQRIRAYLDIAGHGDDIEGPLFRPVRGNQKRNLMRPDAWTPTPSTAWSENTRPRLASGAVTRCIRCARRSSRPRLRTARSLRTCRKPPGTATHQRPSSTTGAATTPKRRRASLRPTNQPSDLAGARGVCQMSASWIHNPQSPHSNSMQISPQWAEHREIRKEHREERESQLAADLEMSRTAEQSAAAMAQMVVKSGFILNGGGIIAIPAVATLFGLDAEKMLSQLMLTAGLFIGGLSVAWLASIFGFFALAHKGDLSYTNAVRTARLLEGKYSPWLAQQMAEKAEAARKRSDRLRVYFLTERCFAIILCLTSFVLFIAGSLEGGRAILKAPHKAPIISPATISF